MKPIRSFLVAALLLGFASSAQALPITDIFTPASPVTLATGTPYEYEHDLLQHGFDPVLDTLTSATLTLDISGPDGQPLVIAFDGTEVFDDKLQVFLAGQPFTVALSFLSDGLLTVTLTKDGGGGSTFSFVSSTLFAQGTVDNGNGPQIPEPGTLALLAIGLLGVGRARLHRTWT